MALVLGRLASGGNGFWDVGASVTQPPFQGGTPLHRERAAGAAYTQAADAQKAAAAAKDAAKITLDLTKKQLEAGYANYLALLSAEQAYQQALINLAQAKSNRYGDTAALFQALGGGWWNRPDLTKS
jgi:outer membrane protein TolC